MTKRNLDSVLDDSLTNRLGLHSAPAYPHVGFLLKHRNRALKVIRWKLRHSTAAADVSFCTRLDQLRYKELESLLLVLAAGKPDWLARIDATDTLTDLQRVFIDFVDEDTALSSVGVATMAQRAHCRSRLAEADISELSRDSALLLASRLRQSVNL